MQYSYQYLKKKTILLPKKLKDIMKLMIKPVFDDI